MDQKPTCVKKKTTQSHIFDSLTFSACHTIVFVVYWFVICPLIFMNLYKHYVSYKIEDWFYLWPLIFWICALVLFIFLLCCTCVLWRIEENHEELTRLCVNTDQLVCQHDKTKCHSIINEKPKQQRECIIENKGVRFKGGDTDDRVEIRKTENNRNYYEKHRHTECPKSHKPNLRLKIRPLSELNESRELKVLTPLTPRELFFMDLIQAANESPTAQIPQTESLLYNERKYSDAVDEPNKYFYESKQSSERKVNDPKNLKPLISDEQEVHDKNLEPRVTETEIFVANVPKHFSESNVVFMYIPNSETADSVESPDGISEQVSLNDDVFIDCE